MDKNLKNFIYLSLLIVSGFVLIFGTFVYFYQYSTINTYNRILLILMTVTILITMLFILSGMAVFYVYRFKKTSRAYSWLVQFGLKILFPAIIFMSGFLEAKSAKPGVFTGSKDAVRKFYIDVNNIMVLSGGRKYSADSILVLLPHCLQETGCAFKVTNSIDNCRRCGKCCIGEIAAIAEEKGVRVSVVTGGTAARNIVSSSRPKLILSVACERDLTSGIADVGRIPVIGLVNERPHGPCNNTMINIEFFRRRLESILK